MATHGAKDGTNPKSGGQPARSGGDDDRVDPAIDRTDASTWPEIMSLDDVAHILDITIVTARRNIASGELPATKFGAGYRVSKTDLLNKFRITNPKTQ